MQRVQAKNMNKRSLSHRLFLFLSVLGAIYLAAEAVLQSQGRSICAGEGCKVVAQYSRFGDLAFVLAGFVVMALLAGLAAAGMRGERTAGDRTIDAVLIAALAAEGFLAGDQIFWLGTVCTFCISVFAIFVALGILRIAAGHRQVAAGFVALLMLLGLFYVVLPAGGPAVPKDAKLVLFYSTECKHCTEIRKELDESGLEVTHLLSKDYSLTLKGLGIDEVPTLLVNGPYERVFLTGTKAIRGYLASCRTTAPAEGPAPAAKKSSREAAPGRRAVTAPAPHDPLNLFPVPGEPGSILNPPPDEGLCKEQQKCD
jgi:hypothetical protein